MMLYIFTKDNCPPCEAAKPEINALIDAAAGLHLPVMQHRTDSTSELMREAAKWDAEQYKVKSTPTVVLAKDGKRLAGWTGGMIRKETILRTIYRYA